MLLSRILPYYRQTDFERLLAGKELLGSLLGKDSQILGKDIVRWTLDRLGDGYQLVRNYYQHFSNYR